MPLVAAPGDAVLQAFQHETGQGFTVTVAAESDQESATANMSNDIRVVDYQPRYQQSFQLLNEEWITRWFAIGEADAMTLGQTQGYILDKGGHILIALLDEQPVGTRARMRIDGKTVEPAKMSVSAQGRRKGLGLLLGDATVPGKQYTPDSGSQTVSRVECSGDNRGKIGL